MVSEEITKQIPNEDTSLGTTVRQLRQEKRMTLEALARASSLSTAMISKIENGNGNPSINSLRQIAKALGVPTALFFAQEAVERTSVVAYNNKRVYSYPHAKISYTAIVSPVTEDVKFVVIEAQPGAEGGVEAICHEGFEQGMVIEGELELTVGDQVFSLKAKDTISFPSTIPHRWVNKGDVTCRSVWAIAVNHVLGAFPDEQPADPATTPVAGADATRATSREVRDVRHYPHDKKATQPLEEADE